MRETRWKEVLQKKETKIKQLKDELKKYQQHWVRQQLLNVGQLKWDAKRKSKKHKQGLSHSAPPVRI
jgi:hypothetical protein